MLKLCYTYQTFEFHTCEAIVLWTKSFHSLVKNLSAYLRAKFEAFMAITQMLVSFLVQRCKNYTAQHHWYNNHINSNQPQMQTFQNNMYKTLIINPFLVLHILEQLAVTPGILKVALHQHSGFQKPVNLIIPTGNIVLYIKQAHSLLYCLWKQVMNAHLDKQLVRFAQVSIHTCQHY